MARLRAALNMTKKSPPLPPRGSPESKPDTASKSDTSIGTNSQQQKSWGFWKAKTSAAAPSLIPSFASIPPLSTSSRLLSWFRSPELPSRVETPLPVKSAVVIGVHGYFPAKITRKVLGEPTGTSQKFASEAAKVVKLQHPRAHVTEIALDGEGLISDRIEELYKQLKRYKLPLQQADLIFFAAHSQGTVVSLSLADHLLSDELFNPKLQRLCVLSMAGALLGPMPGMDQSLAMKAISRIEHASLVELFELQRSDSSPSTVLRDSLTKVLDAGAKLVLVGSADDQLVPLYSALATNLQHPNVFRAVYLDGATASEVGHQVVEPLLELACRQFNAGASDHGVVRELSELLAGQLVSGGHSKLYSYDEVYKLALRIATYTTQPRHSVPEFTSHDIRDDISKNPFVLPWSVRALLSDANRSDQLRPFVQALVKDIQEWKPEKKQLKDLKYRLGGVTRSKL